MKKILKIIPFGFKDKINYFMVFVCDVDEYENCKKLDIYSDRFMVDNLNCCEVGDVIKVKRFYDLGNLDNFITTITLVKI